MRFLTRSLFWICWPALYVYFYHSHRSRVLIVQDGKVLLVKGWWSLCFGDDRWALPGGGIGRKEQPLAGAQRELAEELSIRVNPGDLQFLGESQVREYGLKYQAHFFVYSPSGSFTYKPRKPEIADTCWRELTADPVQHHLKPEVVQALQLLAKR